MTVHIAGPLLKPDAGSSRSLPPMASSTALKVAGPIVRVFAISETLSPGPKRIDVFGRQSAGRFDMIGQTDAATFALIFAMPPPLRETGNIGSFHGRLERRSEVTTLRGKVKGVRHRYGGNDVTAEQVDPIETILGGDSIDRTLHDVDRFANPLTAGDPIGEVLVIMALTCGTMVRIC